MNRIGYWWVWVGLALSTIACGGAGGEGPEIGSSTAVGHEEIDTGQLRQAVTFAVGKGHGIHVDPRVGVVGGCDHINVNYGPSNPCLVPPRRNLTFRTPQGGSSAQKTATSQAMNLVRDAANAVGWSITFSGTGGIPVDLVCYIPDSNDLGKTNYSYTWGNSGPGLKAWTSVAIRLDTCRIEDEADTYGMAYATALKRVAAHEMMHALGFHHRNQSPVWPCSQRLMRSFNDSGCGGFGPGQYWLHPEESAALDAFDVW